MKDKKENFLKGIFDKILKKEKDNMNEGEFLLNSRPIDDGECYKGHSKNEKK